MEQMEKPLHVLQSFLNKNVFVVVKGNKEYRGTLVGYDVHINLVLKDAEEVIENQSKGIFPTMIVRGDNVIYISPS
ncbi:MAG: LSM domain-containing protein [Thermoplasmata archaeon]|jgi:small nuclear ribonucleoprotein